MVRATSSSMTRTSHRTSSPFVVTAKSKNGQQAFSRAARSRTHASTPSSARSRNRMPSAVRTRPTRAWWNSRWYSRMRSGPVSGAALMSQAIGVVVLGWSIRYSSSGRGPAFASGYREP